MIPCASKDGRCYYCDRPGTAPTCAMAAGAGVRWKCAGCGHEWISGHSGQHCPGCRNPLAGGSRRRNPNDPGPEIATLRP